VPSDGTRLGVHCSDSYSAAVNGNQHFLGPKSEIQPATGDLPYPYTSQNQTGDAIFKRLQVRHADLDPAENPGALYFVEGQLIAADDAAVGNGANNVAHRQVLVAPQANSYEITLAGTSRLGEAAIAAWRDQDPTVVEDALADDQGGRFLLASKATALGGGMWQYEYAVHNLTSDRAAGWFEVRTPGARARTLGFHDVDYHSGEPYDGADWAANGGWRGRVRWATDTFASNPDANALRWGTLYNFRFVAPSAPGPGEVRLGTFRPGGPAHLAATLLVPGSCTGNGVCDPTEDATSCPADCAGQGGLGGSCGNGTCEPGESACSCPADCAPCAPSCPDTDGDGIHDTCDTCPVRANADQWDADADGRGDPCDNCQATPNPAQADADGDAVGDACDCAVSDAGVASEGPSPVHELRVGRSGLAAELAWSAAIDAERYDVTRGALDALAPGQYGPCLENDVPSLSHDDPDLPAPGQGFFYLVRADSAACGAGILGHDHAGNERVNADPGDCP
jgi:hypothetical protein